MSVKIIQAKQDSHGTLLKIWEDSVRSTHKFLIEDHIIAYKHLIRDTLLDELDLYCIQDDAMIRGFIGISGEVLEMLFVDPRYFDKGYGRLLVSFAFSKGVKRVDVNEQNEGALGFYQHLGFEVTSRQPVDGLGKPYPILTMLRRRCITISSYKPSWPIQFQELCQLVKQQLGDLAIGIHHIGSTSVIGLAAKDVLDLQVTVRCFSELITTRLTVVGFKEIETITSDHRPYGREAMPDAELQKQFFQKTNPPVNLHVRISGRYNQRYPLLCRDYLRNNHYAAKAYESIKINLAKHFPNDFDAYYDIKDPVFDLIMSGAEEWAAATRWKPTISDE